MMLTRITVDCRVWFFGKRGFDFSLRSLGNELVLLGQVHQHRRMKPVDFAQVFLSFTAVISDRSVDPVPHGRQECHQPSEAIAEYGDLAGAPRQLGHGVDGVLNLPGSRVSVVGLIEAKAVLPVGFGSNAEVDARLLTPE